jgi:hypothetical protein
MDSLADEEAGPLSWRRCSILRRLDCSVLLRLLHN